MLWHLGVLCSLAGASGKYWSIRLLITSDRLLKKISASWWFNPNALKLSAA